MKNLHPARQRLLVGCLLLLAAFFYAFAPTCGLVGRFIQYVTSRLLGQTGSTLLAMTLLVTGVLFVIPHDGFGRFFRWALHGREARVATVVRDSDQWVRAAEVRRIVAEAIKAHTVLGQAQVARVAPPPAPTTPELSIMERRKLDTVRNCLKQLQYVKGEYEPVVQALTDLNRPVEALIKSAIDTLHAGSSKATRVEAN